MSDDPTYVKTALRHGLLSVGEVQAWASATLLRSGIAPDWLDNVVMSGNVSSAELSAMIPYPESSATVVLADIADTCRRAGRISDGALLGTLFDAVSRIDADKRTQLEDALLEVLRPWDELNCPAELPDELARRLNEAFATIRHVFHFQLILETIETARNP